MKIATLLLTILLSLSQMVAKPTTDVDLLAEKAVISHPEMDSLKMQVKALTQNISASRIIKDPVLSVEYSSMPVNAPYPGEHAMSGIQFKFQQTLPFPGKNDRREDVAKQYKAVKLMEIEQWKNMLKERVKQAYWNLAATRILRDISRKHIALIKDFIVVLKGRYEEGIVSQYHLLRLEVMSEQLIDSIDEYDKSERILESAINTSLNRPYDVDIVTPDRILLLENSYTLSSLQEMSKKYHPLLKVWREKAKLERTKAAQTLAEKKPDFTLWFGYRIRVAAGLDNGTNFLSLGFSLPLPFNYTGSFKAKNSYFTYRATSFDAKVVALLNDINYNLDKSLVQWNRSYNRVIQYEKNILPKAKRTLQASLASYQTGKADFDSLYQSELLIIMLEKKVILSKIKTHLMSVTVEMLTGGKRDEK